MCAGMLVVINADSGATVASFKAPERADQVVWDEANRRIYVTGGDGFIGVFAQNDADHYSQVARVPSAPGAKTAIWAKNAVAGPYRTGPNAVSSSKILRSWAS